LQRWQERKKQPAACCWVINVETNLLPPIHLAVGGTSRVLEGVMSQATSSPEP
jgi:hypothetical protein